MMCWRREFRQAQAFNTRVIVHAARRLQADDAARCAQHLQPQQVDLVPRVIEQQAELPRIAWRAVTATRRTSRRMSAMDRLYRVMHRVQQRTEGRTRQRDQRGSGHASRAAHRAPLRSEACGDEVSFR